MRKIIGMALVLVLLSAPMVYSADKININTASKAELVKIPNIGDKIADRIIVYREKHGAFKSTDELMKVKGIGKKKFEKIKDLITVGE